MIWRSWICNYFREIFKFRDFMNTIKNFEKFILLVFSRSLNISRKIILTIICYKLTYNMFIFSKFEFFWTPAPEPFRENLLIKSRNQNIFEKFKLNRNLQTIPFKMMYNMSMLRHWFSNERWGGGTLNHLPLLFCKSRDSKMGLLAQTTTFVVHQHSR